MSAFIKRSVGEKPRKELRPQHQLNRYAGLCLKETLWTQALPLNKQLTEGVSHLLRGSFILSLNPELQTASLVWCYLILLNVPESNEKLMKLIRFVYVVKLKNFPEKAELPSFQSQRQEHVGVCLW